MTVVYPSSGITVLCDCPYTGETRELRLCAEKDEKRRNKLQRELKQTNEDLIIAKNVLVDTRSKLALFQRTLGLELGWVINPLLPTETTWKDRVREESYLKSELIHLVDYLRECDPRYRTDPACHPTKLSTSTEDLLSVTQERTLKHLYHDYTVYRSVNETRAAVYIRDFFKLKHDYENRLYCNKLLEKEIFAVKERISDLQKQFLEDKSLIDYITSHHFKMKGTFTEDISKNTPNDDEDSEPVVEDAEAIKYKGLWEKSKREKQKMLKSVEELSKKLQFANIRIVRAEGFCSGNIVTLRSLAKKMKYGIVLEKSGPKRKNEFGKFSVIQYRTQRSQLQAAISENRYLREFLGKAILSKEEDLQYLKSSLQSVAGKYRATLEDVRSKAAAK